MSASEKPATIREQLTLPLTSAMATAWAANEPCNERLKVLLAGNLDFHDQNSAYATHVIHSFPAKFPPQLPRLFIENLTHPGDVVLDPMAGSGTTLLEAYLARRRAIGLDIDPLALRIASVKVHPLNAERVLHTMHKILHDVEQISKSKEETQFRSEFDDTFDDETCKFIRYWFSPAVTKTLFYLAQEIQNIEEPSLRLFFEIAFSSLIITKSGGVSFALDLAHTRPHRAKIVYDDEGNEILREIPENISPARLKLLTKTLRPVLLEFEKRVRTNLRGELGKNEHLPEPRTIASDAQHLPLANETVDLIVTSPPYASNAIDYMRAHKFSLVWFGYSISVLSQYRHQYIGDDGTSTAKETIFPAIVQEILEHLQQKDKNKKLAVRRYYGEMKKVLQEMYRVLHPGKAAILVVGTSIIRGIDIRIGDCLGEIGEQIGFEIPAIGTRMLDRNRRMLPASKLPNNGSQIQQRMHQEYVIGFYKPSKEK